MNFPNLESNLEGVCNLIQILRSEDGCPWDQEQTSNSLTKHLIEESYELVEAIENHDLENIEEEIGDLLLNLSYQIVFLKEKKYSNESTLIKKLFNKIHTRHPHVFSDLKLKGSAAVEKNWQKIKSDSNKSNADSIPKYLPSLLDPLILGEADYTKGNRLSHSQAKKMPSFRRFGNSILTLLCIISSILVSIFSTVLYKSSNNINCSWSVGSCSDFLRRSA